MATITQFKTHKPTDRADPGFSIPGYVLRWLAPWVSENNPGRIWSVLRKDDLPKELQGHITKYNMTAFKEGGDTVRRGDLVLGFAPVEQNRALRKELDKKAADEYNRLTRNTNAGHGMSVFEQGIERVSDPGAEEFRKK